MRIYMYSNGARLTLDYTSVLSVLRIILLLFTLSSTSMKVMCARKQQAPKLPAFKNTVSNFTFTEGNMAVLNCRIQNLGARTVIWRKNTYPYPLTVGTMTYFPDKRFTISHVPERDDHEEWNLFIKNIKREDAGIYECQISSKERYIRKLIQLVVLDREFSNRTIRILGPRMVKKGESFVLACNATGGKSAPNDLDWVKDDSKLVSDKSGRINITKHISYITNTIISNLTVHQVKQLDEGTYTCRTSDGMVNSTSVEIIGGGSEKDKRTISQHAPATSSATSTKTVLYVAAFLAFNCSSSVRNLTIISLIFVAHLVYSNVHLCIVY